MPEPGCTFPRAAGTSVGALAAAFAGRLDMRRQLFLARRQAATR
jgi:hypothetical protein